MDYTRLSATEVRTALCDIGRDARATFGHLDSRQLNWKAEVNQWSIGQCFEHLVTANALMMRAADMALANAPRNSWQRLPLLPALFGWVMIRSQAPNTKGKFTAPPSARPTTSEISVDIIDRFVDQHDSAAEWLRALEARALGDIIMVSPFASVITYSVLDGLRLLVAHDRRHFEQARRVMCSPAFSSSERSLA